MWCVGFRRPLECFAVPGHGGEVEGVADAVGVGLEAFGRGPVGEGFVGVREGVVEVSGEAVVAGGGSGEVDGGDPAARVFAANERVNRLLIAGLDPAVWRAKGPGKVRTVAAMFSPMHNVRCKWVRLNAPHLGVPKELRRGDASVEEALGGRIRKFRRDGWAKPWPAGIEMVCYMISHEAHHRGQVCMLAHQVGFPVGEGVTSRMWAWERLWREGRAGK